MCQVHGRLSRRGWLGRGSIRICTSGMQVANYVKAAHAPRNSVAWQAPVVLLLFPLLQRMDTCVAEDIRALGGVPVLPCADCQHIYGRHVLAAPAQDACKALRSVHRSACHLSPWHPGEAHDNDAASTLLAQQVTMPPAPLEVNLDATALCALVSSVSNEDALQPHFVEWAEANTHWQQCLDQVRSRGTRARTSAMTSAVACLLLLYAEAASFFYKRKHLYS
jgi:hypothetical protein